jgi:uncharacterized coiled-coil protein SlyX
MPMNALESRLMDVELRFMTLERFAHELSDVVAQQGRAIDALTLEIKRLRALSSEEEAQAQGPERPPHY